MDAILFDNGGTLTDDPFPEAIRQLEQESLAGKTDLPLEPADIAAFFAYWDEVNQRTDIPFGSHYLQEEFWPARALLRLDAERRLGLAAAVPELVPRMLARYRTLARDVIENQPQWSTYRELLTSLRNDGVVVAVASNDREFASRAMLTWTGLMPLLDHLFVSEALSTRYPGAEKPAAAFFRAVLSELGASPAGGDRVVYVGDSEWHDIAPARRLGLTTVRRFNASNPVNAVWVDSSADTAADFSFSRPDSLRPVLSAIFGD